MVDTKKRMRPNSSNDDERTLNVTPNLISVKKSDIPAYLHSSEFYLSLRDDGENSNPILVPVECMKMDDSVNDNESLRLLLLTLRFWVADSICDTMLDYAMSHPFESYEEILTEFYEDMPLLKYIQSFTTSAAPMVQAIQSGVLDFVKYFLTHGQPWHYVACEGMAATGNLSMLKYAIETNCPISRYAAPQAAAAGHLHCLQYLHENGAHWDEQTAISAAECGHLSCLQFAHLNGCPWPCSTDKIEYEEDDDVGDGLDNICTVAARGGQLECLKYGHSQGVVLQHRLIRVAAKHPNGLDCLKYGHEHGLPLTSSLYDSAVACNNFEMIRYLHNHKCPWSEYACDWAAKKGHLECLKFLHENGCMFSDYVCAIAVKHRHADVVLYLLRNGCAPSENIWDFTGDEFLQILECFLERKLPWFATPDATASAAKSNFLEGLKRLVENGCPWHPQTTAYAATNKNVEMLQFAIENGCLWATDTCLYAALAGSVECLKYAHTHGAVLDPDTCAKLMASDGRKFQIGMLDCFKYAHQHGGCPLISKYTFYAARDGHLDLVKYLHEQGCPWDPKVALQAAQNGHADCLDYVLSHGCAYTNAVYNAAKSRKHELCMAVAEKYATVS